MAAATPLSLFSPSFPLSTVLAFCEAPVTLFAFDATCTQARVAVTDALRVLVLQLLPQSQHALLSPGQPWRELYRSLLGTPRLSWNVAPSLDRPRFAHTAVVYKSQVVVFGGRDGERYMNDVATLSLAACSTVGALGAGSQQWLPDVTRGERPSPKRAHTAVVVGQHMYVLGGGSDVLPGTDEMHALDLELLAWRALSRPQGWSFLGHTCVPAGDSRLVVFGGCWWGDEFKVTDELREYDIEADRWTAPRAVGAKPCARYRHSMVCLPGSEHGGGGGSASHGRICVLWGGYVITWKDGCARPDGSWAYNRSDMLTLDTSTYTWTKVQLGGKEAPLLRGAHSCVPLGSDHLLFFGGGLLYFNGVAHLEEDCDELFTVNTKTWAFEVLEPGPPATPGRVAGAPAARGSHTAVVAAVGGTLGVLVLGGRDYNRNGHAELEVHRGRSDGWLLTASAVSLPGAAACAAGAPEAPAHDATAAGS